MLTRANKLIRTTTALVVVAVALFAATVSYDHIETLAVANGQSRLAAYLLPLSVDGLILSASLVMLHDALSGNPGPILARWMLWLGIGATVTANVAAGAAYGPLGAVISAWPAVAFVGSAELAMGLVRRSRLVSSNRVQGDAQTVPADRPVSAPASAVEARPARARKRAPAPTRERAELRYAALLAEGNVPSLRAVKRDMGVGTDKARELRDHLATVASRDRVTV